MQQLERQVIDAERQAEKAFQQVRYNLIKNAFPTSTNINIILPKTVLKLVCCPPLHNVILTVHELDP